ncbi:NAD-dependent dehydratase [Aureimonas sp. Leaf454]|uniref:UDP-glucuronic acid decarboxylase family protein n=1 Tax=Aureimonas sp. Leaf454 TaxID=1736381 RepID=UPI0006F6C9F3|nr:UDP-glucuronic acid decarboxylase family protein [Aureimonas sp. Leaf454]KQT50674.1 NAD-dependent dehydratase [Aureimonas sp. Leaf454]
MSKILVTGGSGFLGTHLCGYLLRRGHEVICLDNFSTSSRDNVAELQRHSLFHLVVGDVRSAIRLEADQIYHLACPASPPKYQADPVFTMETSVLGAINVLEMARRTGARVLMASTSEIYGEPTVSPQAETYRGNVNCWGPRACYDEGKRSAEALFFDYHHQYGVDVRVARIFNTYGPHMAPGDGRVVSNLIVQALRGQRMTVYGDGRQTRSLCYADDLVLGLAALMNSREVPGPINLGNDHETSVGDVAKTIRQLVGGPSQIHFMPLPQDDPTHRRPDLTLARRHLDWEPRTPLVEGLLKTIRHFEEALDIARGDASGFIAEAAE